MEDRRLIIAASVGAALLAAAGVSDFVTGSFWERHAMLTSLLANLLVVGVTVVVVNEIMERRDRRRWSLLAQSVLFALTQSARATWTGMIELLGLGEVQGGSVEPLLSAAAVARDSARVSRATRELLSDKTRRGQLQQACSGLSAHASDVIAKWAPIMVGARPYAEVLNRHVELVGRLEWLSNVLVHGEPPPEQSVRDRVLARSSVTTEHAEELLDNDAWLHDQIVAVTMLATELDYRSRELAFELVPMSWWDDRTSGLMGDDPPRAP